MSNADDVTRMTDDIGALARKQAWNEALGRILTHFAAESGTIHALGEDGVLHLTAASAGSRSSSSRLSAPCRLEKAWPASRSSASAGHGL